MSGALADGKITTAIRGRHAPSSFHGAPLTGTTASMPLFVPRVSARGLSLLPHRRS